MSSINVKSFTGKEALQYIDDLADLRLQVFKAYPYLYKGDKAEEEEYLHHFIQAENNIIVIALDGDRVVGASTGMPMNQTDPAIQKPWLQQNIDLDFLFYFGESVLLKEYRKRGIGVAFFEQRESWAIKLNRYKLLVFCAVVRPKNHLSQPKDYMPLDNFWKKRGYSKTNDLTCEMAWCDIDQFEETTHQLVFWYKNVGSNPTLKF